MKKLKKLTFDNSKYFTGAILCRNECGCYHLIIFEDGEYHGESSQKLYTNQINTAKKKAEKIVQSELKQKIQLYEDTENQISAYISYFGTFLNELSEIFDNDQYSEDEYFW